MNAAQDVPATALILTYRKNRHNHRLIFGRPRAEIRRGWHRKLALFHAGDVFAYERWRGDKFGTQGWRIAVCRAVSGGSLTRFPGIIPGAEIWLDVSGKARVKRFLACLDALNSSGQPPETHAETLWRELHHGLKTGRAELIISEKTGAKIRC